MTDVSDLVKVLDLEPLGEEGAGHFRAQNFVSGAGGVVFGGQLLAQSIVAASTAATDHATARSRMRLASTARRCGSSCLLSFNPRTGRPGERITAAATTGPNNAPRPTSSTPATAWNPRARSSRSSVPSHRK